MKSLRIVERVASGIALSILLSFLFIPQEPFYISGPFLGLVAFIPTFYLISRKVSDVFGVFQHKASRSKSIDEMDRDVAEAQAKTEP